MHAVGVGGAAAAAKNADKASKAGAVGGTVPQVISSNRRPIGSQHDVTDPKGSSLIKSRANTDKKNKMNKQGVSPQSVDEARPGSHFGTYQRNGYESEHVAKVLNSRMTQNNQTSLNK